MIDSRKLAEVAAEAADDKKGGEITLIDVQQVSWMTDYLVICSAHTPIQVRAIAEHIQDQLAIAGGALPRIEGAQVGNWVLLDYGSVVIHIMLEPERGYYALERLWGHGQVEPWHALQGA